MATYFQTWNIPGSRYFSYICFDAKSRKNAEAIAQRWLEHKESQCWTDGDIRNGFQGSLVTLEDSRDWRDQSGQQILNKRVGRETYMCFNNPTEINIHCGVLIP